jgi:DNA-directed RNA polymerase specialized sigma24 family protein
MVTSQGKSPDTSSGSRQGPIDAPGSEPDGGGAYAWVSAEAVREAEAELAPEDEDQNGEAESRLPADELLVQAVLEEGLGGLRHQRLNRELVRYAVPVLKQLVASGQIRVKCHRLSRPVGGLSGVRRFLLNDLDDFAQEMVTRALPLFTEAVFVDRRWSPEGGASLTTYFINGCVRHFPDIYRKWLRDLQRYMPWGLDPDPDAVSRTPDPADVVADTDQAVRLMRQVPVPLRVVVARRALGDTVQEAAAEAGLTLKAAEGRLTRLRKNVSEAANPPGSAGNDGIGGGRSDDTQA